MTRLRSLAVAIPTLASALTLLALLLRACSP